MVGEQQPESLQQLFEQTSPKESIKPLQKGKKCKQRHQEQFQAVIKILKWTQHDEGTTKSKTLLLCLEKPERISFTELSRFGGFYDITDPNQPPHMYLCLTIQSKRLEQSRHIDLKRSRWKGEEGWSHAEWLTPPPEINLYEQDVNMELRYSRATW